MKQKHIYSLLDETYTTVKVTFKKASGYSAMAARPNDHSAEVAFDRFAEKVALNTTYGKNWGGDRGRGYTYKVPLAWDVQVGDTLIVLMESGELKFASVVMVDEKPVIDVDAEFDYRWAVQKLDITEFQELTRKEERFAEQMLEVERVKQRESLLDSFRNSLPEGSAARALFEQTTASLQAPPIPDCPQYNKGDEGDR